MRFTDSELAQLPSRYRANLLNTITGYKAANLIGSRSVKGINNLAIFNSVMHMGSNPPLLGILFRPLTVRRDTYENIKTTGYFTVNAIDKAIYRQAHQTAAKYEEEISEFEETGLSEEYINGFPAPFVKKSPIQLGCTFENEYPIAENGTLLLLGAIKLVAFRDAMQQADGTLALDKAGIMSTVGLDGYALPEILDRFHYAQPDTATRSIKDGTQKS